MLTTFNAWLDDNIPSEGILGAGVRYHDKSVYTVLRDPSLKKDAMEHACATAAEVFQVFKLRKSPVQRLEWKFESGMMHTAVRSDGNCLCLLTGQDGISRDEIDRIFYEFQTLWG